MSADDGARPERDSRSEFRFFRRKDPGGPEEKIAPEVGEAKAADTPANRRGTPLPDTEVRQQYLDVKVRLHQRLIEEINLAAIDKMNREELRDEVRDIIESFLKEEADPLNSAERVRIVDDVIDELLGLGPLEPLLQDPTVSDILVNTPAEVYVERHGVLEETDVRFKDDDHLMRIIERIVVKVGRRVDESNPLVDARLPDGSRVNAVVPPIALDGSLLSIRKFAKIPFDLEKLVENGSMTRTCAEMLKGVVQCRLNLLISGGTGTGKTTLLNAVSRYIGGKERIITIEDAAELQLQQRHVGRMETRPPNIEGRGEITQRDLVKNALRMRPDRIIVGEVRGGEAFDMLQAMNTGHDGSITTVHANSPRDALARIEQMVSMANLDVPARAVRTQIASALDVVVQIKRFSDGTRRLVSVCEVTGMEGEIITLQEILRFRQEGVDKQGKVLGRFEMTGVRPHFYDVFEANGIEMPTAHAADGSKKG
ncbi:type II secretion system protein E [Marinicauda salina]|uniref:Type II secretion system protein E n=1 Tax=Marinicauda salina TaxID=2135793 RepID=A0A2U2BX43_9PROT|nr:CpaF family protein [Marinicauda salina]PWE18591.1 type II secretion system protein E [Marinicauda salina]